MDGAVVSLDGAVRPIGSNWKIKGIGDFDGDGKADILLQDEDPLSPTSGWTLIWFMDGAVVSSAGAIRPVALNWKINAVGDFDGDGKADILWRDESPGSPSYGWMIAWFMDGASVSSTGVPGLVPDTDWQTMK